MRIIFLGTLVNILSWVVAFITPEAITYWVGLVIDISDKAKAYLLAIPFFSTFAAVYSLFRLRRYRNPTAVIEDTDVFARYRDTERSGYLRIRILIAVAAASVNTIGLVCGLIWFR